MQNVEGEHLSVDGRLVCLGISEHSKPNAKTTKIIQNVSCLPAGYAHEVL